MKIKTNKRMRLNQLRSQGIILQSEVSFYTNFSNLDSRFMGTVASYSLFLFMILAEICVATDTLTQSKGLSIGETLVSSGETFELGFFSPGNSGKQYVGIWYKSITDHKPVWVANRKNPTDTGSSLTIENDGNLRLRNSTKDVVWSTNLSPRPNGTFVMLSSEGNLILKDNVSGMSLWASFSYPGDSFIAGMEISNNRITGEEKFLNSWRGDDDPTPGNFVMGITTEKPPQVFVWKGSNPYWRTGPWDGWKFIGLYSTEVGYSNGIIVTPDNQQGSVSLTYNTHSASYVTLVNLTPDGILTMSHWYSDTTKRGQTWEALHLPCEVYGFCGPFGVCDRVKSKTCKCLKGFAPKSSQDWENGKYTGGCVRRIELPCSKNTSTSGKEKKTGFRKFSTMKIPDKHIYLYNLDPSACRAWCLGNCSCLAYAYVDGIRCMVWEGDLLDLQQFSTNGADLFLQVAHSELGGDKKWKQLVIILTTIPAAIFLGFFTYLLLERRKATKAYGLKEVKSSDRFGASKGDRQGYRTQSKSSDLPMFNFNTLAVATGDFCESNKLGAGGFGPVYRGRLKDGREIAVKRLSSHSGQGAVEFKNEILLISKLQHRNLVKIIGYCVEGEEKMIMYEYLKNKSLDLFVFDSRKRMQLDWSKRFHIIEGIARGLLYLHRDSCLRIIHRDLKAGNILLDDDMNPKISDFGTARGFEITQELTNTHRVVGTYGYLSPEYAVGGIFSEKSDVFSFGVVLLEIISGIKVTGFFSEEQSDLLSHAWNLWSEGTGLTFMDKDISNSCSEAEFMKCLQIALLCVQDHAAERPFMSTVVGMLTSDTDIPRPTRPTFYQAFLTTGVSTATHPSLIEENDLTITIGEGR